MNKAFIAGIEMAFRARGITDERQKRMLMDKLLNVQYENALETQRINKLPPSAFVQPEMTNFPEYDPESMSPGMAPFRPNEPTGRYMMRPDITANMLPYAKALMEGLRPSGEEYTLGEGQIRFRGGQEIARGPEKNIDLKGADLKVVQDQTSPTGWSYQHIDPNNPTIIKNAPPPLSTTITPYQQETLGLRRAEGEANRKLREDMHNENLALRKDLADLRLNRMNRLPPSAIKDINKKTNELNRYAELIDSYQDQYGGSVILGPTMTGVYSRVGAKTERVNWWKDWLLLDTAVRHDMFGATLTGYEKSAWDRVTINENTDPAIAKQAMQTRLRIAKNALDREVEGYSAAGYEVNPNPQSPSAQPSPFTKLREMVLKDGTIIKVEE